MDGIRRKRRPGLLHVVLCAIVLAGPRAAAAEVLDISEFPLGVISPNGIALGPDENLWVSTLRDILKVTPSGEVESYHLPPERGGAVSIALGPDGLLWFGEFDKGEIGRVSTTGGFGALPLLAPTRRAGSPVLGADGNMWFLLNDTEKPFESQLGRITPEGVNSEFIVTDNFVTAISAGPDGNIWFGTPDNRVGRITPGGQITKFPLPTVGPLVDGEDGKLWYVNRDGIGRLSTDGQHAEIGNVYAAVNEAVLGPDGNLWMIGFVFYSDNAKSESLAWRMTPNGSVTEFTGFAANAFPVGLAAGADGHLWYIDQTRSTVARVSTLDFDERNLQAGSRPELVGRGADGSVWFTAPGRHLIGRIDALGGIVQLPIDEHYAPAGITVDQSGNAWFTDAVRNSLTRVTPAGATDETFLDNEIGGPQDITTAPSGELWFTEFDASKIARLAGGEITEFPTLTPSSNPQGIVALADGSVWFTERGANKIGRRSANGTMVEFEIPTEGSGPYDIVAGSDGNLWFTQYNVAQIARITPAGVVTEFPIPSPARFLTAAGDGAIWFAQPGNGRLGRITTGGRVTEFALPVENGAPDGIADTPAGDLFVAQSTADRIVSTHLFAADRFTAICYGDCDVDRDVSRGEIRLGVRIALATVPTDFCPSMRRYAQGLPDVATLVRAVVESRGECRA